MEVNAKETSRPGPWPAGIAAVTLFVDDLAASVRFYRDTFGLPVTFEDANSTVLDFGNMIINLLRTSEAVELVSPAPVGNRGAGARMQLTINVPDVDVLCADLEARGVRLLNGPMDRWWGIRTAAFQDPDGYIWEIAHKLPAE